MFQSRTRMRTPTYISNKIKRQSQKILTRTNENPNTHQPQSTLTHYSIIITKTPPHRASTSPKNATMHHTFSLFSLDIIKPSDIMVAQMYSDLDITPWDKRRYYATSYYAVMPRLGGTVAVGRMARRNNNETGPMGK